MTLTSGPQEVEVDRIIHTLVAEADVAVRRCLSDAAAAKKQLDAARETELYWRGRASSLRDLLERAAVASPEKAAETQPTTSDVVVETPPASTSSETSCSGV